MNGRGMVTHYPSKRDLWLVLVLWAAVVVMIVSVVDVWRTPGPLAARLGVSLLLLASVALVLSVVYGTGYTLDDERLSIRSGPLRWKVPLEQIEEIFPTHNPLSSPACSLDRLRIRYGGRGFGVMISPEDKIAFLRDLASRSDGLVLEGDKVVRIEP